MPGGDQTEKISFAEKVLLLMDKMKKTRSEKAADAEKPAREKPKKRKLNFTAANIIKALVLLLACFVLVSPLRSCVISGGDFIGADAAQKIAIDDSGIVLDKTGNVETEMIQIDDTYYYKVQFSGTVTDYRYIVNAETGEIIAHAFYHIDG